MAILTFNSKMVMGTNGMVVMEPAPVQTLMPTRGGLLKGTKGTKTAQAKSEPDIKSDESVWVEQEEPSLGSGGYLDGSDGNSR